MSNREARKGFLRMLRLIITSWLLDRMTPRPPYVLLSLVVLALAAPCLGQTQKAVTLRVASWAHEKVFELETRIHGLRLGYGVAIFFDYPGGHLDPISFSWTEGCLWIVRAYPGGYVFISDCRFFCFSLMQIQPAPENQTRATRADMRAPDRSPGRHLLWRYCMVSKLFWYNL